MALLVEQKVWDLFPGMRLVVAAAEGIDNQHRPPELVAALEKTESELRENWPYPNPQSHPQVAAWREAFRSLGLKPKKFPSAVEALSRRVLSGKPLARINPLVDFYNWLSVAHTVPVGGWDIQQMAGGNIHLMLTQGGERFQELGHGPDAALTVEADEVSYADDEELITRHFVWRQSERAKVTPDTSEVFLISELLPAVDDDIAQELEQAFVQGLKEYFDVEARSAILPSGTSRWDW